MKMTCFNTIRSVSLDANGNIQAGTDTEEMVLSKLNDPGSTGYSHPVGGIEFNGAGDKVLLAEMPVSIGYRNNPFPPYQLIQTYYKTATHTARVLEYQKSGSSWSLSPIFPGNFNSKFDIGNQQDNEGKNSRGGVGLGLQSCGRWANRGG